MPGSIRRLTLESVRAVTERSKLVTKCIGARIPSGNQDKRHAIHASSKRESQRRQLVERARVIAARLTDRGPVAEAAGRLPSAEKRRVQRFPKRIGGLEMDFRCVPQYGQAILERAVPEGEFV